MHFYADWSTNKGLKVLADDEDEVFDVPDIQMLLDAYTLPDDTLVTETTFESFDVARRAKLMQAAERVGVTWLTVPNRLTPKARKDLGLEKSDENDVRAIRHNAITRPASLRKASLPDPDRIARRAEANRVLMHMRRARVARRTEDGQDVRSEKDEYALGLARSLPEVPEDLRPALYGKNGKLSLTTLAAVGAAAQFASNRSEFEAICGLHANGYPSQIRSDLMYHSFRHRAKAGCDRTTFRRAMRWLYQQVKYG